MGLSLIRIDTPNANKLVCTKQPVISPAIVAKPNRFPLVILCIITNILSGPGDIAKAAVAKQKVTKSSKFNGLFIDEGQITIYLSYLCAHDQPF